MTDAHAQVEAYHRATKHHFERYARGPGYLDWAAQPDPFRRYVGAPLIPLEQIAPGDAPLYDLAWTVGNIVSTPLNRRTLSQLLFDSLALSAWKRAGDSSWALRVNPSSGNLHPTEGYVLCAAIPGVGDEPMVAHYAPKEHALEVRAVIPQALWRRLSAGLPQDMVLLALTSVHWREAWKYGERAYRYCQLDVGHALGAISLAAAGLGWQARLLEQVGAAQLAQLLGVAEVRGAEAEQPDALLLLTRQGEPVPDLPIDQEVAAAFGALAWQGQPNRLSRSHVDWSIIDQVARASIKPPTTATHPCFPDVLAPALPLPMTGLPLRRVIHQRRSALDMDGVTRMPRATFYGMLLKTLVRAGGFPFNTLPWRPNVHLAFFVHRVDDLLPGLYLLVRDPARLADLQASTKVGLAWQKPEGCPEPLGLYLLTAGDLRRLARQLACAQAIAGDGCFSLAMLAAFQQPLDRYGAWFYPRLYWECGMLGQVLYLEAEAAALRGTGIGCYFDDPMHELLGLKGERYQDLYHFTVGGPVEDTRLTTLPAYPAETL
jgi:SagB-type dehydrogenase family enzyme